MTDTSIKIIQMWRYNISYFCATIFLLAIEIAYITSAEEVNYTHCFLLAIVPIVVFAYIFIKQHRLPKAKRNRIGIAFYIKGSDSKHLDTVKRKFVEIFANEINRRDASYDVVVNNDYHSEKYWDDVTSSDRDKRAKILLRQKCKVGIMINCLSGGEDEPLFCRLESKLLILQDEVNPTLKEWLDKDIDDALDPVRQIDITKISETKDFNQSSVMLSIVFKYILSSVELHLQNYSTALSILQELHEVVLDKVNLIDGIRPFADVLPHRLAFAHRMIAEREYRLYLSTWDKKHLISARKEINDAFCRNIYRSDLRLLEGICSFVLDEDVKYATACMDAYQGEDKYVAKFNKIFLSLYEGCSVNKVYRAYKLYKKLEDIDSNIYQEIEAFTYHEYIKDRSRKGLLLILFFIYDFQNNQLLAKKCLDLFCLTYPEFLSSKTTNGIFSEYKKRYDNVSYDGCDIEYDFQSFE